MRKLERLCLVTVNWAFYKKIHVNKELNSLFT